MSFDFINNAESRSMLEQTYVTITELDLWGWLQKYNESKHRGCMFNNHPNFKLIENNQHGNIVYTGHSWNWVMNIMSYIAAHDIESFKQLYFRKKNM